MTKTERAGKEFEGLVAQMERVLGPLGAVVTSPDYLIDKVTGSRREVDASIRIQVNGVEQITTVECRDYAATVQDDRWLEQLVTKTEKLGVAKTIAVSSTGFTGAAIKTADHYGIELRRMDSITDAEIAQSWVEFTMSLLRPTFTLHDVQAVTVDLPPLNDADFPFTADTDPTLTPLVRVGDDRELLSPADIFNAAIQSSRWPNHEEGEYRWPITIDSRTERPLYFRTNTGERTIENCTFIYKVTVTATPAPVQEAHRYRSADGMLLDKVTTVADLGDVKVTAESFGQFGPQEKKNPGVRGAKKNPG